MNEIQKAFLNGEKVRRKSWDYSSYRVLNLETFAVYHEETWDGLDMGFYLQSMKEDPNEWELYQEKPKIEKLEFDSTDPALPQIRDKINEIINFLNEVKESVK